MPFYLSHVLRIGHDEHPWRRFLIDGHDIPAQRGRQQGVEKLGPLKKNVMVQVLGIIHRINFPESDYSLTETTSTGVNTFRMKEEKNP